MIYSVHTEHGKDVLTHKLDVKLHECIDLEDFCCLVYGYNDKMSPTIRLTCDSDYEKAYSQFYNTVKAIIKIWRNPNNLTELSLNAIMELAEALMYNNSYLCRLRVGNIEANILGNKFLFTNIVKYVVDKDDKIIANFDKEIAKEIKQIFPLTLDKVSDVKNAAKYYTKWMSILPFTGANTIIANVCIMLIYYYRYNKIICFTDNYSKNYSYVYNINKRANTSGK